MPFAPCDLWDQADKESVGRTLRFQARSIRRTQRSRHSRDQKRNESATAPTGAREAWWDFHRNTLGTTALLQSSPELELPEKLVSVPYCPSLLLAEPRNIGECSFPSQFFLLSMYHGYMIASVG